MYEIWHREWQDHPHCRMSKTFVPKPSPSKSRLLLHLSRGQMHRLIELITAIIILITYKVKLILSTSPLYVCRFCEEEDETFAHLLNECPCFLTYRRDILLNKPIIKNWTKSHGAQTPPNLTYNTGLKTCLLYTSDAADE